MLRGPIDPSARSKTAERLIEVAVKLFARRGYPSVTVDEIVQEAGVSKGAFYYAFGSKGEILYEIHIRYLRAAFERVESVDRTKPIDVLRRMLGNMEEMLERYFLHVQVFHQDRIFLEEPYRSRVRAARIEYQEILEGAIREGQRQGVFRDDVEPRLLARAIFGVINWPYIWYRPNGSFTPRQIRETAEKLVLGGVLASERAAEPPGERKPSRSK